MEEKLSNDLPSILNSFNPISLIDMDQVRLMDRMDTKFVLQLKELPSLLHELKPDYLVMDIDGVRIGDYRTHYYDSNKLELYLAHHNGKLNRNKVRYREYINSKLSFLEVKFKNNKGISSKSRIESWKKDVMSEIDHEFIQTTAPFKKADLMHTLSNSFSRITLASNDIKERVTIDLSLSFSHQGKSKALNGVIVLEVKQEKFNWNSPVIKALKKRRIRERSFSKYTTGIALLNPHVKCNNFKENLLFLNKMSKKGPVWIPLDS